MDGNSLAIINNYHLPRENATFRFVIFTDICGEDRTSPAGGTGNLRCAPKTSPQKDKSTALRAVTAPPRLRKGAPKGKRQGSASPGPDAGFLLIKFLGRVDAGAGVSGRGFPGDETS